MEIRMFDPSIGTWVSRDPLGFEAGDADLYRFCGNDPTNHDDPSGMDPENETSRGAPKLKQVIEAGQKIEGSATEPEGPVPPDWNRPVLKPLGPKTGKPSMVIAGHGGWLAPYGMITVPQGTTITFFAPPNCGLNNIWATSYVDSGDPIALSGYYATYGPGAVIPNYVLFPPNETTSPFKPGPAAVYYNEPVYLGQLLVENLGTVWWSACTFWEEHGPGSDSWVVPVNPDHAWNSP
jgi:hypothetical protein